MFLNEADALKMRRELGIADEPGPRFPDWPFGARRGYVTMFEFDRILATGFGVVLQSLVQFYDDNHVGLMVFDPNAEYFVRGYRFHPNVLLPREALAAAYAQAIDFAPRGDDTGSLRYGLDVFAMAGSSHRWAIHADRDWEMGVLITADADGPWRHTTVPWVSRADVARIRGPVGWALPNTDAEMHAFETNLKHGDLDS